MTFAEMITAFASTRTASAMFAVLRRQRDSIRKLSVEEQEALCFGALAVLKRIAHIDWIDVICAIEHSPTNYEDPVQSNIEKEAMLTPAVPKSTSQQDKLEEDLRITREELTRYRNLAHNVFTSNIAMHHTPDRSSVCIEVARWIEMSQRYAALTLVK